MLSLPRGWEAARDGNWHGNGALPGGNCCAFDILDGRHEESEKKVAYHDCWIMATACLCSLRLRVVSAWLRLPPWSVNLKQAGIDISSGKNGP